MKIQTGRILVVGIALTTFFLTSLAISKSGSSSGYTKRFKAPEPEKKATSTVNDPAASPTPSNKDAGNIHCRAGGVVIGRRYEEPLRWSEEPIKIAVKEMASGTVSAPIACTSIQPVLMNKYDKPVDRGTITVACNDGVLGIQETTCDGSHTTPQQDQEEADRIAAEAARIAAEQAAAAAAAAAAATCPNNCNGAMQTYTKSGNQKSNAGNYTVKYQGCNSGHKVVRSSGNTSLYAVGGCYNSIPK